MDYKALAQQIILLLGTEDNIVKVTNCATRLRFVLKDDSLAKRDEINALDGVKGTAIGAGQFQVIIGSKVSLVAKEATEMLHLEDEGVTVNKKDNILNTAIGTVSGIFYPMLLVMCGVGVLKGLLAILIFTGLLSEASGTYAILYAASDSLFYFMPFILAVTSAEKFGCNKYVALVVAGAFFHSAFQGLASVEGATFLGFIPVSARDYSSSVLPIIFSIYLLSKVEKITSKVIPEFLYSYVAPFISIVVTVPLALTVIGPVFTVVATSLSSVFTTIQSISPLLLGAVIGLTWNLMVVFGVHWGVVSCMVVNISTLGYDMMTPVILPVNFAMAGSAFGVYLKSKKAKVKAVAFSGAITAFFGIAEPSIYGTNLRYKRPLIIGCVAAMIGGIICAMGGAVSSSLIIPGILTMWAMTGDPGFMYTVVAGVVALVLSAVGTYLFGYNDDME